MTDPTRGHMPEPPDGGWPASGGQGGGWSSSAPTSGQRDDDSPTTTYGPQTHGDWDRPGTGWVPGGGSVAPQPVVPTRGRRSRLPLILGALAIAAVVVGAGAFAFLSRNTTSGAAGAAQYLPAESLMLADVRLDLPGDQRQHLTAVLGRFPGLTDGRPVDELLTEQFDRLFASSSGGRVRYSTDIKPWTNQQLSIAVIGGPTQAGVDAETAGASMPQLFVLGVTDRAAAEGRLDQLRNDAAIGGATFREESHQGTTIWTLSTPDRPDSIAYAVTDDAVLVSLKPDNIRTALDAKRGARPNITSATGFAEALRGLRADRLGTVAINVDAAMQALQRAAAGAPQGESVAALAQCLPLFQGSYVVAGAYADTNRLVFESRTAFPGLASIAPQLTASENTLARRVPADTALYLDTRQVGQAIAAQATAARSNDACLNQNRQQIQQIEGLLGRDLSSFSEWLGDAAFVVSATNMEGGSGVLATVTNEALARERLTELVTRVGEFGGGEPVRPTTQDYNGTQVTTVSQGGGSSLAYAIREGVLIVGRDTFVRRIIDLPAGQGLGDQARFRDALGAATSNVGVAYIDFTQLAASPVLAEGGVPPDARRYLDVLDRLVMVQEGTAQQGSMRLTLFVK